IPALAQIPPTASLADVVFRRAAEQPQAVVLRRPSGPSGVAGESGSWTDVTASQFSGEVIALAKGLVAAGIEPGDRVALMSHTRYEWTLIDYAIWTAGAVTVPIYETSSSEQVDWILSDSGAVAFFYETDAHKASYDEISSKVAAVKNDWRIDEPTLDQITAAGRSVAEDDIEQRRRTLTLESLATIIYTSGTTGRPKGCELTHRNFLFDSTSTTEGLDEL